MGGEKRSILERVEDPEIQALLAALLAENDELKARVRELEKMQFGPRSEKTKPFDFSQPNLLPFPELLELQKQAQEAAQTAAGDEVEVPAHKRKKKGRRKDFPEHLPRQEIEKKIPDEQRVCCGEELRIFGHEVTQELERIEFCYVIVHKREKGACDKCGKLVVAEAPERVLDRGLMGPNFLARVIYERFANHMPYARLEQKYAGEGLPLSRSVLCSSVLRCADLLEPIYKAHRKDVLSAKVIQSDDTEVVQRFGRKKGRRKVNVWVYRDQDGGAFYEVTNGRSRDGPRSVLAGWSGTLQCDGHTCFDYLGDGIERSGCWAHARRKFLHALEGKDELAEVPFSLIRKIFAIERKGHDLSDDALLALRQKKSLPIVNELKAWLDQQRLSPPRAPKSPLMKAINYALNQWETLERYFHDGSLRDITNNAAERALRSIVVGRKNWLYFGDEEGARRGSILMSLVQSCKELAINPLLYLADVLKSVATTPASLVGELTPRGWKAKRAASVAPAEPSAEAQQVLADAVGAALRE